MGGEEGGERDILSGSGVEPISSALAGERFCMKLKLLIEVWGIEEIQSNIFDGVIHADSKLKHLMSIS